MATSRFINEFSDLMKDTVTHYQMSSRDSYGAITYGSGTEYQSRVVYKRELVRDSNGNQVVSKGVVWFMAYVNINPDQDKITLPDGTSPPILAVERFPDNVGDNHTKLYFG